MIPLKHGLRKNVNVNKYLTHSIDYRIITNASTQ